MTILSTLYKYDSKGKTRVYKVAFDDKQYTIQTGLEGGKLINKITNPTPKGKNTLAEQVEKEAKAKWRKKYELELYREDLNKPHPLAFTEPMAALDYTKVPHRAEWDKCEWITQPKLNGVRCLVQMIDGVVKLTSRKGKQYKVPHIEKLFTDLYKNVAHNIIFDGELYIHGVELGDVTHAVSNGHECLSYKLFDHVDESNTFRDRYLYLIDLKDTIADSAIQLVDNYLILNENDLKDIHNQYVQSGYEGAMLRDVNAAYTIGKRTPGMFKYKHFQDDEFEIIGVEKDKNGGAILHLITKEGISFKSRPMGTDTYRERLLKDATTLIGEQATVKYSELLKTGVPEFNRVISIRNYE